jgi:ribosomal protein S7
VIVYEGIVSINKIIVSAQRPEMFHPAKVDRAGIIFMTPVKIHQQRGQDVGDRWILDKTQHHS